MSDNNNNIIITSNTTTQDPVYRALRWAVVGVAVTYAGYWVHKNYIAEDDSSSAAAGTTGGSSSKGGSNSSGGASQLFSGMSHLQDENEASFGQQGSTSASTGKAQQQQQQQQQNNLGSAVTGSGPPVPRTLYGFHGVPEIETTTVINNSVTSTNSQQQQQQHLSSSNTKSPLPAPPKKRSDQVHVLVKTFSDQAAETIQSQLVYSLQEPFAINPSAIFLEIVVQPTVAEEHKYSVRQKQQQQQDEEEAEEESEEREQHSFLSTTDDLFEKELTRWFVHGFQVCSVRALEHRTYSVPEVVLREIRFRVERLKGGSTQDRLVRSSSLSCSRSPHSLPMSSSFSHSSPQQPLARGGSQQQLLSVPRHEQQQQQQRNSAAPNSANTVASNSSSSISSQGVKNSNSQQLSHDDAAMGVSSKMRGGSSSSQQQSHNDSLFDTAQTTGATSVEGGSSFDNSMTDHPAAAAAVAAAARATMRTASAPPKKKQHHNEMPRLRPRNIRFDKISSPDDDDDDLDVEDGGGLSGGGTATPNTGSTNSSGGAGKNSRGQLGSTLSFDIHRSNTPRIPRSRSVTTVDTSAQISAAATPQLTPQHPSSSRQQQQQHYQRLPAGGVNISPRTLPANMAQVMQHNPTFPSTTSTEQMALFGGHITPHVTPGSEYFLPPAQLPPLSTASPPGQQQQQQQQLTKTNSSGALPPRAPSSGKLNSGRGTPGVAGVPPMFPTSPSVVPSVPAAASSSSEVRIGSSFGADASGDDDESSNALGSSTGVLTTPSLEPTSHYSEQQQQHRQGRPSKLEMLPPALAQHSVSDNFVPDMHQQQQSVEESSMSLITSVPATPLMVMSTPTVALPPPADSRHGSLGGAVQQPSPRLARLMADREDKLVSVAFRALASEINRPQQQYIEEGRQEQAQQQQQLHVTGDAALKDIPSDIVLFDATRNISDNPLGIEARTAVRSKSNEVVLPSVLISGLLFLLDAQHSMTDGVVSSLSVTQVVAQRIAAEHDENWAFIESAVRQLNNDPYLADVKVRNLAELQFALEAHVDIFAGLAVSDPEELYTLVDHDDDRVLLPLVGCSFGAFCLVSAVFHKLVEVFGPLSDDNLRTALKACHKDSRGQPLRESACSRLLRAFNRRRAPTVSLFDFVHYVSRQVARSTGHVTRAITAKASIERNRTPSPVLSSAESCSSSRGGGGGESGSNSVGAGHGGGATNSNGASLGNSFAGVSVTTPPSRSRANSTKQGHSKMAGANESTTTMPFFGRTPRHEQQQMQAAGLTPTAASVASSVATGSTAAASAGGGGQQTQPQTRRSSAAVPPLFEMVTSSPSAAAAAAAAGVDPIITSPQLLEQQQQQQPAAAVSPTVAAAAAAAVPQFYNASFGLPTAHIPLDVLLNALQRSGDKTVVEALAKTGLLRVLFYKHKEEWQRTTFWFDTLVEEEYYL